MGEARTLRLRYTPRAIEELDQILSEISYESPSGAKHIQRRIKTVIELLIPFPHAGQSTDLPSIRKITATPFPYIVFYRAQENEVVIIAVRHGAQNPDDRANL